MRTSVIRAAIVAAVAVSCAWQHSPAVAASGQEAAQKEIFSTFGPWWDPEELWWTTIMGVSSEKADQQGQAFAGMAFSPTEDVTLREIQLGVSYLSGRNVLSVTLRKNGDGVPGPVMREFTVADLKPWLCCVNQPTRVMLDQGQPLKAGRTYWLVLQAKHDTAVGWHLNSISAHGIFASRERNQAWLREDEFLLLALRLLGD